MQCSRHRDAGFVGPVPCVVFWRGATALKFRRNTGTPTCRVSGGGAGVGIGPSNFARHSRPSRQNKTQLHCVVRVTSWAVLPLRASRHNDSAGDTAESAHQGLTPFVFRGWEEQEVDRRVLASTSTHGPVDGLPLCVCVCVLRSLPV